MGKHSVEAEGDAEAADRVHHQKKTQIHPRDPLIPEKDNRADDTEDGQPDQGQENDFSQRRGRVCVGNRCAQAVSFAYIPNRGK
jgi:hypothetical protein